jgi:MFS family permease
MGLTPGIAARKRSADGPWPALASLAVPAAIMLSLLAVARLLYPRPQDLAAGPARVSAEGLPRVYWAYMAGAALAAAGFADFPLISFHFQHAGTVAPVLTPVFYAAVAPMVSPDRRASAYGLFTGMYGTAWVLGSIVIGVLIDVSPDGLVAFCMASELAAIPFILAVRRRLRAATSDQGR